VHRGALHRRPWRAHPDCHCGASRRAVSVRVPVPRTVGGRAGASPPTVGQSRPAGARASQDPRRPSPAWAGDAGAKVDAACAPAVRRETIMG
jgi:hypothetical protein